MNIYKHTGFDLFFANISNKKAKQLVQMLNSMDKTMKGNPLKFKINRKNSSPYHTNTVCITTRYPAAEISAEFMPDMLAQNRKLMEVGLKTLGWTEVEYTGSEFYLEMNEDEMKTFKQQFNTTLAA